jgi:hypothetical protein
VPAQSGSLLATRRGKLLRGRPLIGAHDLVAGEMPDRGKAAAVSLSVEPVPGALTAACRRARR